MVIVVSHIQRIGCQPETTTLYGGQSRSWSAEQVKENKKRILAAYPPPHTPHTARSEKNKKIKITRRIYRRYAGFGRSRVPTRISSARRLGTRPMGVASQNCTLPCAITAFFPGLVASLFSWRCLAASASFFLHAAMNLRPPSVTVSTHTSAFNAVAFQSPAMPNARISLWTQSVHSFPFPLRPLRTAPSRFPKTIHFGSHPPLIRRSVPAHKSLLVLNVVSMLSQPVISRARLYEVIRWSGLLRCAPMIRSKTRWCTVRSLA